MRRKLPSIDEEDEWEMGESEVCFSRMIKTIKCSWVTWIEYLYGIEREE
jgi:hypothetical protein